MEVKGHTIIMATKDNDKAMQSFYVNKLGFKKNQMGGITAGDLNIFFDRHNKAAKKALEPFRSMPTFTVVNIQKTYKDLVKKGVKFVRKPGKEEWGGWFATLVDPDGNYIQIFELPEE